MGRCTVRGPRFILEDVQYQQKKRPILVLEINEIPWRLIDHFRSQGNYPMLKKFFSEAETHTTIAEEEGELSPWITWPSLHRGGNGSDHGVKFLGQDPSTFRGVPIWEEFRNAGESIGICGAMQSWPARDPGKMGFYVPDTFAADSRCIPPRLNAFQALNLRLTGQNGRVIRRSLPISAELVRFLAAAPFLGFRARTLARVGLQLIREFFQPSMLARRPIFQAELLWDIFHRLYSPLAPPAYSAFFTNHVASAMHRYWSHLFPEDFPVADRPASQEHKATLEFAMGTLEKILADALAFQEKNPDLILAFASSMGQAAVKWDRFEGVSTIISRPADLLGALTNGAHRFDKSGLAMVPQITVKIADSTLREKICDLLSASSTASGEKIFFPEVTGDRVSISIRTPARADIAAGGFYSGTKKISWAEAGIVVENVGPASAYHIPEGVLALRGKGISTNNSRAPIKLSRVKDYLLTASGRGVQITSQCKPSGNLAPSILSPETASTTV